MFPVDAETPAYTPPEVEHLLGDPWGVRSYLENLGIYLRLNATAEFAGNVSGGKEGNVSNSERLELIYTDSQGLYGGAAIKGASISPDSNANVAYYGQYFTTKEILFDNKARPTPTATALAQRIAECSRPASRP